MTAPAKQVELEVLPAQMRFIRATERYVLGYGGMGSGKSLAGCIKLAMRASVPGAREGLTRKHLVTLKGTTLRTLIKGDGKMAPVLPVGSYTHRLADRTISIHGGGEIIYFGLDDPDKIGSLNLTGCCGDQLEELSDEEYSRLGMRIRVDHPMGNQLYGVANPAGPGHHLAQRFGCALGTTPRPGHVAFHLRTQDNIHTPAEYRNDMAMLTGVRKARYNDGVWVQAEGLVYPDFTSDRHLVRWNEEHRPARVVVGVDDGHAQSHFAVGLWLIDGNKRMHLHRCHYETRLTESPKVTAIQELIKQTPFGEVVEAVVIDPAASSLRTACDNAGLPVVQAKNDVLPGISRMGDRITATANGMPMLTVDPICTSFLKEIEAYQWKDKVVKDQPLKEMDHQMDEARYVSMYLDAGGGWHEVYTQIASSDPEPAPASGDRPDPMAFFDD